MTARPHDPAVAAGAGGPDHRVIQPQELDARARLLRTAVGFALVPPTEPELRLLHQWLDCWRGVGDVVMEMNRQGYFLHLSNIDAGTWRATFSRTR